jgi:DHA1 family tetracycline resistance protein-like MFS transporter
VTALPAGHARRRAAVIFIFLTILLDMLALGVIIPVLPKLVESFVGGDTGRASEFLGLFGTAWALMQFLFSPLLGALSDRYGRRPVILISNFGLGLDYVLMALAPSLVLLFVGRVISGITSASIATSYAYVADVTPPEQRAKQFGLIGAAFGIGFILGPALGGLLGAVHPRLPFWVAAALSLSNAVYGLLVLPESLSPERRTRFTWRAAHPIGALVLLRSHAHLIGLAVSNFLGLVAHAVLPTVFVLYAGYRYGWDERMVGLVLAVVGLCSLIVQTTLVGPMVARVGERAALLIGLACGTVGFAIFGLAPTGGSFMVGIPVMALWGLSNPAAQGLMSRHVAPSEQGRLQGANASVQGIASLVGPGLFSLTFTYFIAAGRAVPLPGAPFVLAAVLLAAAMAVAFATTRAVARG